MEKYEKYESLIRLMKTDDSLSLSDIPLIVHHGGCTNFLSRYYTPVERRRSLIAGSQVRLDVVVLLVALLLFSRLFIRGVSSSSHRRVKLQVTRSLRISS